MGTRPIRILLADGSRLQREMIRAALTDLGYEVDVAATGREALELNATGEYDLLLVDVILPDQSGMDILQRVRDDGLDQCVVLMASEGCGLSAAGAIRAGADDYVTKPIRLDDGGAALEVILSRGLERRRLTRENRELQEELIEAQRRSAVISLAGAVAHEMNQPLTVITGLIDLLVIEREPPDLEDLRTLRVAAERLSEIVNRLSAISHYHTKPYIEGLCILDLDRSAEAIQYAEPPC